MQEAPPASNKRKPSSVFGLILIVAFFGTVFNIWGNAMNQRHHDLESVFSNIGDDIEAARCGCGCG